MSNSPGDANIKPLVKDGFEKPGTLTTSSRQGKALLIGIDDYGPKDSLQGCVRDVEDLEMVLRERLRVGEIRKLLAPAQMVGQFKGTRPTRAAVIQAIEQIGADSNPDDFVYIHFSGHGCQVPTVYPMKGSLLDEGLCCADNTIIRDVELGYLLGEITKRGVVVLATLDCCHSGGALRDGEKDKWRMRRRHIGEETSEDIWLGYTDGKETLENGQHWFYGDRKYHLIAACQPREFAREGSGHERRGGLFTSSLLRSLANLNDLLPSASYCSLLNGVRAICRTESDGFQCPVLFGDLRQRIFGFLGDSLPAEYHSVSTAVNKVHQHDGTLILDRGSSTGVCLEDEYQLYRLDNTTAGTVVRVDRVYGITSRAVPAVGTIGDVQEGLCAKRVGRGHSTRVLLWLPRKEDAQTLKDQCEEFFDAANPLQFELAENAAADGYEEPPEFYVGVHNQEFEISRGGGAVLPNIPKVTVTGELEAARDLCLMLKHLKAFFTVSEMRPTRRLRPEHQFYLKALPLMGDDDKDHGDAEGEDWDDVVANIRFEYKNESGGPIWITVFNLGADWSIDPLIYTSGGGQEVKARDGIPEKDWLVYVPPSVQRIDLKKGPIKLTESVKMFVSTKAHDFLDLKLPSLADALDQRTRGMRPKRSTELTWDVCVRTYTVDLNQPVDRFGHSTVIDQIS